MSQNTSLAKWLQTLFYISVILMVIFCPCGAHKTGAYMRNSDDGFTNRPNWMANIRDNVQLCELAIPGTHDSSTYKGYGGDSVTTQTLSFDQQLYYGIRYFDIRIRHINNGFALHHGLVYLHLSMTDFLNSITSFLKNNPSETVLFRLKEDYSPDGNSRSLSDTLQSDLDPFSAYYLRTFNDFITLGSARGKFIILSDNGQFNSFGIQYRRLNIQDNYNLKDNWDLYSKWTSVKDQLQNAKNGNSNTFYINYLSGSGGSFPYFVASGHSSPGTSAPRLSTALTTPAFKDKYPDFPRENCFIGICSILFEGTNVLTYQELQIYNRDLNIQKRTVGIIVADFIGDSLIHEIIRNNGKLTK